MNDINSPLRKVLRQRYGALSESELAVLEKWCIQTDEEKRFAHLDGVESLEMLDAILDSMVRNGERGIAGFRVDILNNNSRLWLRDWQADRDKAAVRKEEEEAMASFNPLPAEVAAARARLELENNKFKSVEQLRQEAGLVAIIGKDGRQKLVQAGTMGTAPISKVAVKLPPLPSEYTKQNLIQLVAKNKAEYRRLLQLHGEAAITARLRGDS
jgi:hypothetical protein